MAVLTMQILVRKMNPIFGEANSELEIQLGC